VKTILLLRHGKSKRGPEYETDSERPLSRRGKRDAARVGEWIAEQGLIPDLVLCSPARRARQTALQCAETADYMGPIRFEGSLYFGGDDAYLELLRELDDTVDRVLFVGHNPDISAAVEALSGEYADMPTAALARIDVPLMRWSELAEGADQGHPIGELVWVQGPRELA
jgi:phosphohistidine phosphatase